MAEKRVWMASRKPARAAKIDEIEKRGIIHACEAFIDAHGRVDAIPGVTLAGAFELIETINLLQPLN